MSSLLNSLNKVVAWMSENSPDLIETLLPGLDGKVINALLKDYPYRLPNEVRTLYMWKNGMSRGYYRGYFVPYFDQFNPLGEALTKIDHISNFFPGMNDYQILIFDCNGDCQYTIDFESGEVWFLDVEGDIYEKHWDSLEDLFRAVSECYESGAFFISDSDEFSQDEEQKQSIYKKYGYRGSYDPFEDP